MKTRPISLLNSGFTVAGAYRSLESGKVELEFSFYHGGNCLCENEEKYVMKS